MALGRDNYRLSLSFKWLYDSSWRVIPFSGNHCIRANRRLFLGSDRHTTPIVSSDDQTRSTVTLVKLKYYTLWLVSLSNYCQLSN
jgi:hypothetical protein